MTGIAVVVCVLLLLIAGTHFYWASGGSAGKADAVPSVEGKPTMKPGPVSTAAVGLALVVAAALVAAHAGLVRVPIPSALLSAGCVLLAAVFVGRAIGDFRYLGFFKRIRDSSFARRDTFVYSPLCLLLGIMIGMIILG